MSQNREESQHHFVLLVFLQGLSPPQRWFMSRMMFPWQGLARRELFLHRVFAQWWAYLGPTGIVWG